MNPPNTMNVYHRDTVRRSWLPAITKVRTPNTRMQRLALWLAGRAGLLEDFRPFEDKVEVETITLGEEPQADIARMVLYFMKQGLKPSDLVLLWGPDSFAQFLRGQRHVMVTDLRFSTGRHEYRGITIRVVDYLNGHLVLRKADLL